MNKTILISILCLFLMVSSSAPILKKVILLTRHGDRSPIKIYPNTHQWEHSGQLTGEGMNQLYRLGVDMRDEYIFKRKFISNVYNFSEIHVRSTDKERTLMSAQALLMGLYPHGTGPKVAPNSHLWYDGTEKVDIKEALPNYASVIPIHSDGKKNDILLHAYKGCEKLSSMRKSYRTEKEWLDKELETKEFRDIVGKIVGVENLKLNQVSSIYHALKADVIHGHNKFNITKEIKDKIIEIKDWTLKRKFFKREMGSIGAGILLQKIIDELGNVHDKHRFLYYSVHDGTLLALFSAMGLDEFKIPNYSSNVLFECYETADKKRFIKVFFDKKPLIKDCDPECSYEKFTELMAPGTITEDVYKNHCVPSSLKSNPYYNQMVFLIVGLIIGFILAKLTTNTKIKKD